MDVKAFYIQLIKRTTFFLVFFCLITLIQCREPEKTTAVTVNYSNGKAVSITLVGGESTDSYEVFKQETIDQPVLGSFSSDGKTTVFVPVLPFSEEQSYEVRKENKTIVEFTILKEQGDSEEKPQLLHIYPSTDTVPENLLKMYFVFSKPMQQVHNALDYIKVYNVQQNKQLDIFLELQTELWNKEHTQLTLWLDPGRIKTGLQPNKEKGLPIVAGNTYRLEVSADWEDANGEPLGIATQKEFYVGERDNRKPTMYDWKYDIPKPGSSGALTIHFNEILDAMLIQESIQVKTELGNKVSGTFRLGSKERSLEFIPEAPWVAGYYKVIAQAKLEDLAANNLNTLFDQDITALSGATGQQDYYTKSIRIQ